MTWAKTSVVHDGYQLTRQDKVDLIAAYSGAYRKNINLRVCYSELNQGLNCGKCEKCYRTILGLILAGENPNNFGFSVDASFYGEMFELLSRCRTTIGVINHWKDISDKASRNNEYFRFPGEINNKFIVRIRNGELVNCLKINYAYSNLLWFMKLLPFRVKNKIFSVLKK